MEGWKKFEEENGTPEEIAKVQSRMPQVTKRWRKLDSGDMEECEFMFQGVVYLLNAMLIFSLSDWDILFADDEREANPATFKFIQNALAWRSKEGGGGISSGLLATLLAEDKEESSDEEQDEDRRQPPSDEDEDDDAKSSNEGDTMRD